MTLVTLSLSSSFLGNNKDIIVLLLGFLSLSFVVMFSKLLTSVPFVSVLSKSFVPQWIKKVFAEEKDVWSMMLFAFSRGWASDVAGF